MEVMYQAYPDYEDSFIDLLGDVPRHWSLSKLAYVLRLQAGYAFPSDSFGDEEGMPIVRMNNIFSGEINLSEAVKVPIAFVRDEFLLKEHDVIMGMSGSIENLAIVKKQQLPCAINQRVGRFQCDLTKILNSFMFYFAQTTYFKEKIFLLATGTAQLNISSEQIESLKFALPSIAEQLKIIMFLDHETAKIDTLIEKQQQLIKLLKEKRQAVISHAVTKGLNPTAPMRDSGVGWLGEVPEHWVVSRIKNVTNKIVDGPHFSPKYHDEGYMFISARNIKVDRWSLDDAKYVSEADFNEFNKRVRPELGDVLLTKGGTTGVARAVDLDFPFQVWVHVAVLKTIQTMIDPFYLAYVLNGTACYEQSQQYTFGATNNDLGLSRIAKILFARPPMNEQRELRLQLDNDCKRFDTLITKGISSIGLMQERRTALISAAVTGKIDVRNWQAPQPSNKSNNNTGK